MSVAETLAPPPDPHIEFRELRPDLFPEKEMVDRSMLEATTQVAVVAKVEIETYPPIPDGEKLPSDVKDTRTLVIDNTGGAVIRHSLSINEFGTDLVGAEGGKEKQADKGGLDIDVVLGKHGNGYKLVWGVHDVIEGTTAAAHNRPGAISIIATTTAGGVIPTPERLSNPKENIEYMEKLMGPPALVGKIALDRTPTQNLEAAMKLVANPKDIEVTVLKRPRNEALIREIEAFGARVNPIDAGDLVPSLDAMRDVNGKVKLIMGIGGWEEGVIAAVGAKALGAVAEGRMAEVWKEDGVEKHIIYPEYLRLDDIVPGEKEHSTVTFTAITDVKAFERKGIDLEKGEAQGMQIDHKGFHDKVIPFIPADARRAHKDFRVPPLAA